MPVTLTTLTGSKTFILDTTKLDEIIRTNPGKVADVVTKTANRILADAKMIAPRDPARPPKDPSRQVYGALKAHSDVVKVDPKGLTQNVNFYEEYAVYQELGAPAINLPARPFLTPSVEKRAEGFVADLSRVLK